MQAKKKISSIYNKIIYYFYVFTKTSNKTRCDALALSSFFIKEWSLAAAQVKLHTYHLYALSRFNKFPNRDK